jgi:Bacterial PH domain
MEPNEMEARIKAQIWQAIAENDVDLSSLDKDTRTALVNLVTLAALDAVDQELDGFLVENQESLNKLAGDENDDLETDEQILWEGRPFLSISVRYMITDQRLRIASGLMGRSFQNIELVRIQDMDHSQSFGERILNRGDLEIRSHDPASPIVVLENVSSPEEVYDILRRAVRDARHNQGLTFQEEM